jgi:signal transduction histidine kinase
MNQTVSFDHDNKLLTQPIYLTKELTLDYKNNVITFDFASFDFAAPAENKFQYKLVGFNNNWLSTNNNHSATFTNLYPGTYYFKVRGSNSDGVWSNNECKIKLVILPPWYMTWWFIITMILLFFLIVYGLYKYRLNEANKLHLIRNRIAADLHDEIGSTLSSISLFSEVVKLKSKTKMPEITPMLNRISSNIDEMMEAMNDIVWTINSNNDNFENILIRMRSNASELFEAKGYELVLNFDQKLYSVKLGMVARKNVYLIFKEAINNVVKYANGDKVVISISYSKNEITLLIEDNGIGFETSNTSKGNGLNTMNKRAIEINGTFSVYSKEGIGTKVKFSFPIT